MSHADDGTLHAYLDGGLSPIETARLEAHLAECGPCRARLQEEKGLVTRAGHILALAEPPERAAPPLHQLRRSPPAWPIRRSLAWAASFVVTLGAAWFALSTRSDPASRAVATAERQEDTYRAAGDSVATPPPSPANRPPAPPKVARARVPPARGEAAPQAQDRVPTPAPDPSPQTGALAAVAPPAAAVARELRSRTDEIDLDSARALLGSDVHAIDGVAIGAIRPAGVGTPAVVVEQQVAPGVVVQLREEAERAGGVIVRSVPGPERIVGRVTDATSGAPVANAQVGVTGTPLGAITSERGAFAIESVTPGTYTVRARMLGYEPTVASAARVDSGRTTAVEFSLERSLLALDEVVVTSAQEAARGRRAALADSARGLRAGTSSPSLARRIGRLRVEISGPLTPDSLTKLLDKLAPIR